MDPQGNTTSGIGASKHLKEHIVYDLLVQEDDEISIFDIIVPTQRRELVVAPCTMELAAAEVELVGAIAREHKLRHALEPIRERCDYIPIQTLHTALNRHARLSEAPNVGRCMLDDDHNCQGALAYRALAVAVMARGYPKTWPGAQP